MLREVPGQALEDKLILQATMRGYEWFLGADLDIDDGGTHVVVFVKSKDAMAASFFVQPFVRTRVCYISGTHRQ